MRAINYILEGLKEKDRALVSDALATIEAVEMALRLPHFGYLNKDGREFWMNLVKGDPVYECFYVNLDPHVKLLTQEQAFLMFYEEIDFLVK